MRKILIVEDEAIIALGQSAMLMQNGYDAVMANSGKEALDIILADPGIGLVLMDIDLGKGINGPTTALKILAHKDVPIVFLTSHGEKETVDMVREITRYGYVIKNSGDFVLLTSIEMAFELFSAHKSIEAESEKTRKGGEFLDATLNSIGDAVIVTGIDGCVMRMNPVAEKMTGWNFSDAEGKPLSEIYSPLNPETGLEETDTVSRTVKSGRVNLITQYRVLYSRNRIEFQIAENSSPIINTCGDVIGVIVVFSDMTVDSRMQAKLRESEATYRDIVETSHDLVWKCDREYRFTYLNAAWESHGYRVGEMMGRPFGDFQRPEVYARDFVGFYRHMHAGFITGYETVLISKAGDDIYLTFNSIPLRDSEGSVIGAQGTARDITARITAQNALLDSEIRYRTLFENASDGIFIMTTGGEIRAVNTSFLDMHGYQRDEMMTMNLIDLDLPETAKLVPERIVRILQGETLKFEVQHLHKKGHRIELEVVTSMIRIGNDDFIVAFHRDIGERKKIEELNSRYTGLLENIPEAIIFTDMDFRIITWNAGAESMYGWGAGEVRGKHLRDILRHEFPVESRDEIFRTIIETGKWVGEVVQYKRNGTPLHVLATVSMIKGDSGKPKAMVGIHIDITARKHIERELKKSHERFRQIAEQSREMIWEVDRKGLYTFVSEMSSDLLGYPPGDIIGKKYFYDFHPEPGREKFKMEAFDVFSRRETFRELHNPAQTRDGNIIMLSTNGIPVIDDDGNLEGYRGSDTDITERLKAGEKIKNLLKEKEFILREVHHRIRNNMNTISSLLHLQAKQLKDPHAAAALDEAKSRIQAMMMVYNKLLMTDNYRNISSSEYLNDLLESIESSYRGISPVTIEKNIESCDLDSKLLIPAGIIINELVTNAFKYAYPPGCVGKIHVAFSRAGGDAVVMLIRDNGAGMQMKSDIGNMEGFGMYLVNSLVRQMNGNIDMDHGSGLAYTITIPVPA